MVKRRTVIANAGAAFIVLAASKFANASSSIRCKIYFEGNTAIPEGEIDVAIEDTAVQNSNENQIPNVRLSSSGKSQVIEFDLPIPSAVETPSTLQIVAYLERKDGWLLARGSAAFSVDMANEIELFKVMYE
jgi:hypothetical protein